MAATQRRLRSRRQRGVALVEFAISAVMLFMLLFGIINYAYMLSFRQAISQGAAEGARAGAVAPSSLSTSDKMVRARNALNEAIEDYDIECVGTNLRKGTKNVGTCGVAIAACEGNAAAMCVSVTLDYLYKDNSLLPSIPGFGIILPDHLRYTAVAEVNA